MRLECDCLVSGVGAAIMRADAPLAAEASFISSPCYSWALCISAACARTELAAHL